MNMANAAHCDIFACLDSVAPALLVKNTFLCVDERCDLRRGQRRMKTEPRSLWTALGEYEDGASSYGDYEVSMKGTKSIFTSSTHAGELSDEESSIKGWKSNSSISSCSGDFCKDVAPMRRRCINSTNLSEATENTCEEAAPDSRLSSLGTNPRTTAVHGSVWELSQVADGSWAVQQALDAVSSEKYRYEVACELEGHVAEAALHIHANHVLQRLIMSMHSNSLEFVVIEITNCDGGACAIANNKYGCRVIQRLLEHCSANLVVKIVEDLLDDADRVSCNRYGKYAIQCLLEHGTAPQIHQLMQFIVANAENLAVHQHGVSVIGQAMSCGHLEDQLLLAQTISSVTGLLKRMARSKHGNYCARLVTKVISDNSTIEPASAIREASRAGSERLAQTLPASSKCNTSKAKGSNHKNRRRGRGGGVQAQHETEARDILASVEAAYHRCCPERLAQVLDRVQMRYTAPENPLALSAELAQACDRARQTLSSLEAAQRANPPMMIRSSFSEHACEE